MVGVVGVEQLESGSPCRPRSLTGFAQLVSACCGSSASHCTLRAPPLLAQILALWALGFGTKNFQVRRCRSDDFTGGPFFQTEFQHVTNVAMLQMRCILQLTYYDAIVISSVVHANRHAMAFICPASIMHALASFHRVACNDEIACIDRHCSFSFYLELVGSRRMQFSLGRITGVLSKGTILIDST